MPHNIGKMFYYGKTPWHELGNKVERPATAEEALKYGRLDWEVELIDIQTAEIPPTYISRRKAVVRKDKQPKDENRVLGVVHPGFRALQNRAGLELVDNLLGAGQAIYHTGGYLGKGEVVWVLAKLPGNLTIRGKDVVEPYLLFSNSHDGTRAIDLRLTTIRVVCQNTLNLALSDKKNEFIFKQSHSVKPELIQVRAEKFFDFIRKEILFTEKDFQRLADHSLTQEGFEQYLGMVLPYPKKPEPTAKSAVQNLFETRRQKIGEARRSVTEIYRDGYSDGDVESPAEPTLWGALNAVTAYVDHVQTLGDVDRYSHVMFGEGARLKEVAYKKAIEIIAA